MNKYIEALADMNVEDVVVLDDMDDCIIGIAKTFNGCVLVYSEMLIIEHLSKWMEQDDAWDYYDFNIVGGYFGENNPVFMIDVC